MAIDRNSAVGLEDRPAAHGAGERRPGAVPAGGDRRKKRGIWPWILGLLALLALGGLLAALLAGDDDPVDRAAAAGDAGTLVADGDDLFAAPAGALGQYERETATGRNVVVQSVVQGSENPDVRAGFTVGTSAEDAVFVEWGGDLGPNEADFQPEVGQRVNLRGPVYPAPENPARRLRIGEEDAQIVTARGGFVNADQVDPVE